MISPFETPEESGEVVEARLKALQEEHPFPTVEYQYLIEVVAEGPRKVALWRSSLIL